MSTWNYRVVRTIEKDEDGDVDRFAIHEAYYAARHPDPHSITANAMTTSFETLDGLRAALTKMLASLDKPVLNYEDY